MGRDAKNEKGTDHLGEVFRSTMQSDAWRALSTTAQALYPWLKLEWRGPKNNNNGKIRLSTRQAADRLGVNQKTAARAFHELQAKGFISVTEPTRLGLGGAAKSPAYEITEIELPHGAARGGRRLYRNWKVGCDFAVTKASANNPNGNNGQEKTQPQNRLSTVVKLGSRR